MLDKFRETAITWDKATRRIYSPITANASDSNGRKLNIQVVNSGQVENLTGATLHLCWETKDKAQHGLDAFKASDISKGEFEIFYTTGMLSNVGELNATLVLVDNTGQVVSDWFKITVARGIDNDAIQSENSFTALTQALIDVSNLEQNYTPRLNDLTAQLQHKATKTELNVEKARIDSFTSLPAGSTTGDAELIDVRTGANGLTYPNAGSAIREQIKDVNGVLTIIPDKVSTVKDFVNIFNKNDVLRDHFKPYNTGVLTPLAGYSLSNKRPISPNTTYTRLIGSHTVFLDASSNYISGTLDSTFTTPPNARYYQMTVQDKYLDTEQLILGNTLGTYQPFGGKLENIKDGSIDRKLIAPQGDCISFWASVTGTNINFDTINNKISIPVGSVIFRNKYREITGLPMDLAMSQISKTALQGLFYNAKAALNGEKSALNLFAVAVYDKFPTSDEWVMLATFTLDGQVNMVGEYAINGVKFGLKEPSVIIPPTDTSRIVYTSEANAKLLEIDNSETSLEKFDLIGTGIAGNTSEIGLYSIGKQFNRLRDLTFKNFKGYAALVIENTVGTHSTLTASDLLFLSNKIGFLSEFRAEYITISNSQFNGNEVGARIKGGNVQLNSCIISDNVNGIEVLAGSNDSHGIISDCQVNHNTGIALLIDGIANGQTISGCHFYDATIEIKNTTTRAVRFDNCAIAGNLNITNCYKVIFNNCYFPSGYGLIDSVITNATVVGTGNEVEEATMESVFNTH